MARVYIGTSGFYYASWIGTRCYFNNDAGGFATKNAIILKKLVNE